jgi:ketosteroid isomerase-like protein
VVTTGSEALARAIAAWNAGDHDRYLELYASEVVLHSGSMGEAVGIDAVRAMYQPVWDTYESRIEIDDLIGEADAVACRYRWIATERATGGSFTVPGITVLHFTGDRCTERWDLEGSAGP